MTIAACYLSMEGVVFGTDSTTTFNMRSPTGGLESHHFNHGQKIFEVGRESQLAVAIWGIGSFDGTSYRTIVAELGDEITTNPQQNVEAIARLLSSRVWKAVESVFPPQEIQEIRGIAAKSPEDRTAVERDRFEKFGTAGGGFCIGGCCPPSRHPSAYEVTFDLVGGMTEPAALYPDRPRFWGAPNMVNRLIYGVDFPFLDRIIASKKWSGDFQELLALARAGSLQPPGNLPLREAVDWVYASVFATIKAFKFSQFLPICGGAVEIAVISTDRPFRWVKHKPFDAAL